MIPNESETSAAGTSSPITVPSNSANVPGSKHANQKCNPFLSTSSSASANGADCAIVNVLEGNGYVDDADSQSRLNELATEAAKKVCEFNALIADVESRSRNQLVLLERYYDKPPLTWTPAPPDTGTSHPPPRPTQLDLFPTNTTTTTSALVVNGSKSTLQHRVTREDSSVNKLKVDELPDFGPLSKKIRQGLDATASGSSSSTPVAATQRRLSAFAASLPRIPCGRKASVPTPYRVSSALASPQTSRRTVAQLPFTATSQQQQPASGKVAVGEQQTTVGGLVKLFSEVAALQSTNLTKKDCVPPSRPSPSDSPPAASTRLLVRGGQDKTVIYNDHMSSSPASENVHRVSSPDRPQNGGSAKRGISPSSFANTFSFGRNLKLKKSDANENDHEKQRHKPDTSQLERLLAGLNFSKFRITDRLGMGSVDRAGSSVRSPSPRNNGEHGGRSQQPAAASKSGASATVAGAKLGQQNSVSYSDPINHLKHETDADSDAMAGAAGLSRLLPLTRTVSQPSGLSCAAQRSPPSNNNELLLRTTRTRVTHSEDREGGTCSTSSANHNGGAICRVSEDIASLITDIRQHFQLYRKLESAPASVVTTPKNENPSAAVTRREDYTKNFTNPQYPEGVAEIEEQHDRRDSDYVVSVVSDDYSESTGITDDNCEIDTESTSSSFIFSPTTASITHSSPSFPIPLLERNCLIAGAIQQQSKPHDCHRHHAAIDGFIHNHEPLINEPKPQHVATTTTPPVTRKVANVQHVTNSSIYSSYSSPASSDANSHKLISNGRSLTYPPQTRKNSANNASTQLMSDAKFLPPAGVTSCGAWVMDNPEHRLSSASFPESAVSLSTDSMYSTAGSSSLYSYIDHSDSSSQPVSTLESDQKVKQPRYHSDPMSASNSSTSQSTAGFPSDSTYATAASKVSVIPSQMIERENGAVSRNNLSGVTAAVIPLNVRDDLIRESGSCLVNLLDETARPVNGDAYHLSTHHQLSPLSNKHNLSGEAALGERSATGTGTTSSILTTPSPVVQARNVFHDSFRRSDKRLPRGPFGVRLEEDQIRRTQQRQLVQDLSFLHSPDATSPVLQPEASTTPTPPTSVDVSPRMPKRRQSAAVNHDDKLLRQYVGVKSSPDLFRNSSNGTGNASPQSSASSLRPGEICRSVSDAEASAWKKINEETDSAIYSGSTESVPTESVDSRSQISTAKITDFRTHIVRELYDTENSYVESLQILEKYYETLKNNEDLVDKTLAENMFFQIPNIKSYHENLLTALKNRMESWDSKQKIGDIIVETFTKEEVIDTYMAFVNNWKTAKDAIKLAKSQRPTFGKFLEQCAREHRGKLNLDALLIMLVQRIPRYELLIKKLLKHTPEDHPDRTDLECAQNELHDLALKINAMEQEVDEAERIMIRLKELEIYIDGLTDLVEPNRKFLKFDMVTMASGMGLKKDRCLFLFSDLLVITNLKRKSGAIRKPSTQSCSPQLYPTLENNKYKLLMKVSLEDLDLSKPALIGTKRPFTERELLETDLTVLSKISELTGNLSASHQTLDDAVRNMMATVNRQLTERQTHANDPNLSKLELTFATQNGLETISVNFLSVNKRNAWERTFLEAKQALGLSSDRRPPPDFLNPVPIRKTRAGLQITCAAATSDLNAYNMRDMWVSNTDGYVGQMCVLSMQPEPAVTSCIAVCNCRITCIASIPAATIAHKGSMINSGNVSPVSDHSGSGEARDPSSLSLDLDSDDSSDEDASVDEHSHSHSRSLPLDKDSFMSIASEEDVGLKLQHVHDPTQGTMWIGTEDGSIFVYYCNDNIRIKKPRLKLQHASAVQCIAYTDQVVFVGLGNGQVATYSRPVHGFWETNNPVCIQLGPQAAPVQRMTLACGKMWCSCVNMIYVINIATIKVEASFPVVSDATRSVSCLACSGLGVWISVQNSAVLRLCNALSYEFLADINLTPSVQKMLAGCDEILRQHKFACLRITALLACKDLLWVGTSAGVILTISLPHIVQGTTKLSSMPTVTGIWHGHTGQVRFLHCVEQHPTGPSVDVQANNRRPVRRDRRLSITAAGNSRMLVASGGDGYEDFRCTSQMSHNVNDGAGRDDSTNHLLLWQC